MKKPELLCPAGNITKLKTAIRYGADAVYIGGNVFGLRARADNFTPEEMQEAIAYAHERGKSVYVTMNILARNEDLEQMKRYAQELYRMDADGVIISDLGAVQMVREAVPELKIHVSTQANNLNWRTCKAWLDMGCERINLARELSLSEISQINQNLRANGVDCDSHIRLEAFVHGAMCMSYSGRCMLSDYMAGRSSNRGDCAQPCRWNYRLVEEQRPGEYLPIYENERGTFLFNSKDLCMLEYIPQMMEAGIGSLKIEGRMKSEYYTGVTVSAYRRAIDACWRDPEGYSEDRGLIADLMRELSMVSHRDYTTGFYLGKRGEQVYSTSSYMRNSDFIGITSQCREIGTGKWEVCISQRGNFRLGDTLDFLIPGQRAVSQTVDSMTDAEGTAIDTAPHAMMDVRVQTDFFVPADTLVRRVKSGV
jgi:putative protease